MASATTDGQVIHRDEFERVGFAIVRNVVRCDDVGILTSLLQHESKGQSTRQESVYAARNLLANIPAVAAIAKSPGMRLLVEPFLGKEAISVRGILFDKIPGANWRVGWHQDQVIPVAEQKDVPGFTAWSVKHGVPHARPPAVVLERMLTLRIHLDDCCSNNGALRVIPGTHRLGLLDVQQIREIVDCEKPVVCEARAGDVLVMRPLLLHASSPATSPSHRRVIHLEFASAELPGGLEWPRIR
jgi:Phytanoyl-CoA dioxygenase (PhyH)